MMDPQVTALAAIQPAQRLHETGASPEEVAAAAERFAALHGEEEGDEDEEPEQLGWEPYQGERGGHGWRSSATGEVRYQVEKPNEAEESSGATTPAPTPAVHVHPDAEHLVGKLFGRQPSHEEYAAIACAAPGANVWVTAKGGKLTIQSEKRDEAGEIESNSTRHIWKPWFAPLTCQNKMFGLRGGAKGQGLAIFSQQVEALAKAGVKAIIADAAGGPDGGGNGYYTWPLFGYSGRMRPEQIAKLPPEIRTALGGKRDVRDLFDLPGGKEAWKAHGSGINDVQFDLSEGSRSRKALAAYQAERATRGQQ